jgi:predicted RNA-binding Zn ribbon-like protein
MRPQLASDGERGVTFEPTGTDVAGWVGASAALGLAFFVAAHGTTRFGICDASDCADAYIDSSKNTTKRYCSSGCARLESVRAFRQRRRKTKDDSD